MNRDCRQPQKMRFPAITLGRVHASAAVRVSVSVNMCDGNIARGNAAIAMAL